MLFSANAQILNIFSSNPDNNISIDFVVERGESYIS